MIYRITSSIAIALACSSVGSSALAQTQPSVKTLDDTAQRAHDPNAAKAGMAKQGMAAAGSTDSGPKVAANERDWAAIDANHDNLISPEEMEAFLASGKSAKPSNSTSGATPSPTQK